MGSWETELPTVSHIISLLISLYNKRLRLLRNNVEFATKETRKHPSQLLRFKEAVAADHTFGKFFDDLKKARKLSATDIQRRSISIKLDLYNNAMVSFLLQLISSCSHQIALLF